MFGCWNLIEEEDLLLASRSLWLSVRQSWMPSDRSISHQPTEWRYLPISSPFSLSLPQIGRRRWQHTIREVHGDIYYQPISPLAHEVRHTSLLCGSFRYFPLILQVDPILSALYLVRPGKNGWTYTQTPSFASLFLTLSWKTPFVYLSVLRLHPNAACTVIPKVEQSWPSW